MKSKRTKSQQDAMVAWNQRAASEGFCVTETGGGCGWRHAHSPNCTIVKRAP